MCSGLKMFSLFSCSRTGEKKSIWEEKLFFSQRGQIAICCTKKGFLCVVIL